MGRPARQMYADEYKALRNDEYRVALNETNDCTVVALAAATGRSYKLAYDAMAMEGRLHGKGSHSAAMIQAAANLGFDCKRVCINEIIDRYPLPHRNVLTNVTSHHPDRFADCWPKGTFLMFSRSHVLCVKDGVNLDWSRGRALRIISMFEVVPKKV